MENEKVENKSNIIPMTIGILLVLVAGAYFFFWRNNINTVDGVINVANVNGTDITRTAYEAQLVSSIDSYKAQGIDTSNAEILSKIKTEALDNLINNELLSQNILISGVKASEEEVEKQFQLILTQAGGVDGLNAELVKNNLTESQLRENIFKQLTAQAYLSQNVDMKSIAISDDEIARFYTSYSQAQKESGQETVPALSELSEQIRQQLILNRQQALVADFLVSLREKAKINIANIQ